MTKDTTQWYASWFDTPFYHILYKDRNHHEAQRFMDNLTKYLSLSPDSKILDLACGRGRHSRYLNSLGYRVTGVDISKNNIAHAKQFETEKLHFEVHDMSATYNDEFDAVLNLFTSFGYFDNDASNLATINAIKNNLNTYGLGVIDFMNSDWVIANLIPEETKTLEGINFHLKRYVKDGYIFKDISFTHNGQDYIFQERVKAFSLEDFEALFEKAGVYMLDVFGDYNLRKFYKGTSERLIMIFK